MAFRWHADDDPTLNAGLVAAIFFRGSRPVLLENPIFCVFSGGSGSANGYPNSEKQINQKITKIAQFATDRNCTIILPGNSTNITDTSDRISVNVVQQVHDVKTTAYRRRCDAMTSHIR